MEISPVLALIVQFLAAIIAFLASLVSGLVLAMFISLKKEQREMRNDWMGRNEINGMVNRVESNFNNRHSAHEKQYKELNANMDNMAAEFQQSLDRVEGKLSEDIGSCAQEIIRQVGLALKIKGGESLSASDVLSVPSGLKHEP